MTKPYVPIEPLEATTILFDFVAAAAEQADVPIGAQQFEDIFKPNVVPALASFVIDRSLDTDEARPNPHVEVQVDDGQRKTEATINRITDEGVPRAIYLASHARTPRGYSRTEFAMLSVPKISVTDAAGNNDRLFMPWDLLQRGNRLGTFVVPGRRVDFAESGLEYGTERTQQPMPDTSRELSGFLSITARLTRDLLSSQ